MLIKHWNSPKRAVSNKMHDANKYRQSPKCAVRMQLTVWLIFLSISFTSSTTVKFPDTVGHIDKWSTRRQRVSDTRLGGQQLCS